MHRCPMAQRTNFGGEHEQVRVDLAGRPQIGRRDQPIAAPHDFFVDAGEIDRAALPGDASLGLVIIGVDAAHPRRLTGFREVNMLAHFDTAGKHRAGDDQAGAGDGEGAVYGEAEIAVCRALAGLTGDL